MTGGRAVSFGFLLAAWALPALVAGALGWNGIWGTGSALVEFLIPVPVAGGVFHLPSFLLLWIVVASVDTWPPSVQRLLPFASFAVFVGALSLQLDHDRLLDTLTTDYDPHGSALRFDDNPLYLFIACDGLSAFLYSKLRGFTSPARLWPALLLVPVAVIGTEGMTRSIGGPRFEVGAALPGPQRGQMRYIVFATGEYDETEILGWLESMSYLGRPWESANYEDSAIWFTNSLQLAKSHRPERLDERNTVATVCYHEDDLSTRIDPGFVDCFAGRPTIDERLREWRETRYAGEARDVSAWLARADLCADWKPPPPDQPRWYEIELDGICRGLRQRYAADLASFESRHGADATAVERIRTAARALGLDEAGPGE